MLIGSITFLGMGLLLSLIKSEEKLSLLANILYLGLAMLGGLWWPTYLFPEWLQNISKLTPTYYLLDFVNKYIKEIKGLNIPSIAKYAAINRLAAWVDNPSRTNGEYFNLDSCNYNSNNKLEELVKIAKHHDNECVLIYTYFDETNMVNDKILRRLEEEGIKTNILPKSIKADKRIQWFEKQKEAGVRAVICNPSAVQTGLDLLDFTTIVFYEFDLLYVLQTYCSRKSY